MPAKRGRFSQDEHEYIIVHAADMTPEEMAAKLNRTPEAIGAYVQSRGISGFTTKSEQERAGKLTIRADLRNSEKWRRLKQELTDDEIKFFEEEYVKLFDQFRGNVLASETTQVFDCIKFEILKSRNMMERRKARDDISRLEEERKDAGRGDGKRELNAQLKDAREYEQSRTREYVALQERHDALMKSLKSTRDQRIHEIESGKETILGLLKALQRQEVSEQEGREMELMRMAGEKEYKRLGQLHEYEDGTLDRPILSPDTVNLEEESSDE